MKKTTTFLVVVFLILLVGSSCFLFETATSDLGGVPVRRNLPLTLASFNNTIYDPVIDGWATSYEEWINATKTPDMFSMGAVPNSGFLYLEKKANWTATSPSGNRSVVPGLSIFVAHDINGYPTGNLSNFQISQTDDWNVMELPTPQGTVTCWVFARENTLDDSQWLPLSGLANSPLIPEGIGNDLINDTGYIVRLNNDPLTDRHWFPGFPAPGDPAWLAVGATYYWAFGNWNFSSSFYDKGLDSSPYPNEEYEWTVRLMGEPTICYWIQYWMKIDDQVVPVPGGILMGQWWLHFSPWWSQAAPVTFTWVDIINLQVANLTSILSSLPPEIQTEVNMAIVCLNLARADLGLSLEDAMTQIGSAVDHLMSAGGINSDAWNVIIHLLALEQYIAQKKLYQAENMQVKNPYNKAQFDSQIWDAYADLRLAGLEVLEIFEMRQNYTTYGLPVAYFQYSLYHAQTAQEIAETPPPTPPPPEDWPPGGISMPPDRFVLLAPYIGSLSAIVAAIAGATVFVKRRSRKKENR